MKKSYIISVFSVFLIIPIFFGIYIENFLVQKIDLFIILALVLGFFSLLIVGKIIDKFGFKKKELEILKTHEVIKALHQKNGIVLLIFFPITMIMEELIFRYYLIGFLVSTLQLKNYFGVLFSATLFSLYHVHTWFSFKSLRILFINLSYTLLLGFFLGFVFFTIGIIPCIVSHYIIALYLWYSIFRNSKESEIH